MVGPVTSKRHDQTLLYVIDITGASSGREWEEVDYSRSENGPIGFVV